MSSKVPVAYIELRTFAHATEDEEKVLTALRNTLPPTVALEVAIKKSSLKGHHGNPIILFEAKIREKSQVQAFLEYLASRLSSIDKENLSSEISRYLNKASLYIRLDKQAAYLNKLRIGAADPIHFRIHFKKPKPEEIIEACRRLGLLPQ